MAASSARRVVALLTLAFVLLGTAFALLVPMFGNFDEQTHLDRARYTARHPFSDPGPSLRVTYGSWEGLIAVRRTPGPLGAEGDAQRERYRAFRDYPGGNAGDPNPCPGVCQNIQYAHPPAWYVLMSPVTAALEAQTFPRSVLVLRILDVLLVAPLVALGWYTGRQVWPDRPRRALAVAAGIALAGPLAYTASGVNNDSLLLLSVGIATALAARTLRRGATIPWAAALGAAIALGLLTKVQMVLAAPTLALTVLVAPQPWRERLRNGVVLALAAAPGVLWWAMQLADEGPLSPPSSELLAPARPGPWSDQPYVSYVVEKLPILLGRIWGTFDAPVTFIQDPVRLVLGLAVGAVVVGWLLCRGTRRPRWDDLRWVVLAGLPASLALGVMWASLDAHRRTGEVRGLAPRYLHPSVIVLAVAAVGALSVVLLRIGGRRVLRPAFVVGVVGMAGLASVAFLARGVQAAYGTSSWRDILDRAGAVGPVGEPVVLLAPMAVLWVAALALVCREVWRSDDPAQPSETSRTASR